MATWKVRSCPRCRGDIFIDRDLDGWYEQCLQCSHRHELQDLALRKEQPLVASGEAQPNRQSVG